MPHIARILKEEIQRLARKEVKVATAVLRKDTIALKRAVAELKRRVAGIVRIGPPCDNGFPRGKLSSKASSGNSKYQSLWLTCRSEW